MKTILKHGFMNNMTAYCPSCGCEFTYEQEDITTSYKYECDSPFLAAWPTKHIFVICPDCGYSINIVPSIYITGTTHTNIESCDYND